MLRGRVRERREPGSGAIWWGVEPGLGPTLNWEPGAGNQQWELGLGPGSETETGSGNRELRLESVAGEWEGEPGAGTEYGAWDPRLGPI